MRVAPKACTLPAQLADGRVGGEQVLRGDAADRQHDARLAATRSGARRYGRQCATSSGCGSRLFGGRLLSTLAMNTCSRDKPDAAQHGVEQLARAADERLALPVFLGARAPRPRSATRPAGRRRRRPCGVRLRCSAHVVQAATSAASRSHVVGGAPRAADRQALRARSDGTRPPRAARRRGAASARRPAPSGSRGAIAHRRCASGAGSEALAGDCGATGEPATGRARQRVTAEDREQR